MKPRRRASMKTWNALLAFLPLRRRGSLSAMLDGAARIERMGLVTIWLIIACLISNVLPQRAPAGKPGDAVSLHELNRRATTGRRADAASHSTVARRERLRTRQARAQVSADFR